MRMLVIVFFFNDTATTEIYTLSLHDALPILAERVVAMPVRARSGIIVEAVRRLDDAGVGVDDLSLRRPTLDEDRKSTRLNSSHAHLSYAVFCLKKKTDPRTRPRSPRGRASLL